MQSSKHPRLRRGAQTSDDIGKKLAKIVKQRWSSKLEESKLKEKMNKYDLPNNCGKLTVPRLNPEKSSFISSQIIIILGFKINSILMKVFSTKSSMGMQRRSLVRIDMYTIGHEY